MLLRVALVRTDVSEEFSASFIRVTRIGALGTTLAVRSFETSALTRATLRNIPEDGILDATVFTYTVQGTRYLPKNSRCFHLATEVWPEKSLLPYRLRSLLK
jgi:hypothetical protein